MGSMPYAAPFWRERGNDDKPANKNQVFFLLTGEVVLHPIWGALNKPSLRIVKKKYSSLPFAFTGILPLPGHSRFVKIYLIRQSLTAFCFSLRPPSSEYSCIRHYLLVPYGF